MPTFQVCWPVAKELFRSFDNTPKAFLSRDWIKVELRTGAILSRYPIIGSERFRYYVTAKTLEQADISKLLDMDAYEDERLERISKKLRQIHAKRKGEEEKKRNTLRKRRETWQRKRKEQLKDVDLG